MALSSPNVSIYYANSFLYNPKLDIVQSPTTLYLSALPGVPVTSVVLPVCALSQYISSLNSIQHLLPKADVQPVQDIQQLMEMHSLPQSHVQILQHI